MESEIYRILKEFLLNEWEIDEVYDARFFVDKYSKECEDFNEPRKVRYTLNCMTNDGLICKVKDDYNVFYISSVWYNLFNDEFNSFETCVW